MSVTDSVWYCSATANTASANGSSATLTCDRPRVMPIAACGWPLSPAPRAMPRVPKKTKYSARIRSPANDRLENMYEP